MDQAEHLAETLEALLARRGWTPGTLARKSRVPKATIDNWLRGRAARPRAWQSMAQVAAAFELDSAETTRLFAVAGHPSVPELMEMHLPTADRVLLEPWVKARSEPGSADTSRLPGDSVGDTRDTTPIPVTRIPDVAPLPAGSRVHFRRNPYFVGRQQLLLTIARTLGGHEHVHGQSVDTVVLSGIGGVGKTQLATEWVHRYGQYFTGGVFWVGFADPSAIPAGVAAAGSHTFLRTFPSFGSCSLDEQVRLVWSSWHDSVPRLLIFDGCEDETLLQQWRPANGNSSVIVTSRRSHWDPLLGVRALPLGVLERSEGIRLLGQYRPDGLEKHEELDRIAAELGDLPLALHLAGTFLKRYQYIVTPRMYLDQLRSLEQGENHTILDHPSFLGGAVSPTDHEQNIARTFALSYEQLDVTNARDSLALRLLAHAARFAPGQQIPRHLLRASVILNTEQPRMYAFEDALMRVLNLGLLEVVDGGAICIHRLVAKFINAAH